MKNQKIKNRMKDQDKKLLKLANEGNIDEIIKFIEDFLRKLQ